MKRKGKSRMRAVTLAARSSHIHSINVKVKRDIKLPHYETCQPPSVVEMAEHVYEHSRRAEWLRHQDSNASDHLLHILNVLHSFRTQAPSLPQRCRLLAQLVVATHSAYKNVPRKLRESSYTAEVKELSEHVTGVICRALEQMNVLEKDDRAVSTTMIKQEVLDLIYDGLPHPSNQQKRAFKQRVQAHLTVSVRPCHALLSALLDAMSGQKYRQYSIRRDERAALRCERRAIRSLPLLEFQDEGTENVEPASSPDLETHDSRTVRTTLNDHETDMVILESDEDEKPVKSEIKREQSPEAALPELAALETEMRVSLDKLVQYNIQTHVNTAESDMDRLMQLRVLRNSLADFRQIYLAPTDSLHGGAKLAARLICLDIATYIDSHNEVLLCVGDERVKFRAALNPPVWTVEQIKNYNLERARSLSESIQLDDQTRAEMYAALGYCLRAQVPLSDADLLLTMQRLTQFTQDLPFNAADRALPVAPGTYSDVITTLDGVAPTGSARIKSESPNV